MCKLPKLLLHICCGPDATAVVEELRLEYEVIGFFHNPNIYPATEYRRRFEVVEKVAECMNFKLEVADYDPEKWFAVTKGWENEPEKGERCKICFEYNLKATADYAKNKAIDFFTTSLTISPHKNSEQILRVGEKVSGNTGGNFLARNFKKRDGFKHSLEFSRKWGLYRQRYCGCRYSLRERSYA